MIRRLHQLRIALLVLVFAAACSAAPAPPPSPFKAPVNLDFEEGWVGGVPPGWHGTDSYYRARISRDSPKRGERCVEISSEKGGYGFGNLMQTLDAAPYRGRRVRFRAAVRAEVQPTEGHGELWLRVDRKVGSAAFFQNMVDRPIVDREWKEYEIVAEVAPDAATVHFGGFLSGQGRIWLDAASFEVTGLAGEGNQPPRPLAGRSLENLVAFTRLLGYVRFFHPSDGVAQTDWDAFAIQGVQAVEDAESPEDLAIRLERVFQPIAPTVQVFPKGRTPEVPEGLLPPAGDPAPTVTAWRHLGFGPLGGGLYRSRRINNHTPLRDGPPEIPAPAEALTADLGGGVSCRVPLSLYTDPLGTTIPRTPSPARPASSPLSGHPSGWIPSGGDRATRLAGVALLWTVFQHFYPYFDVVPADWPAALEASLKAAAVDLGQEAFQETLERLIAPLQDGHGGVSYGGGPSAVLPLAWTWAENRLVVTATAPEAGDLVRPGDAVVAIGGVPVEEALRRLEERVSGATAPRRRLVAMRYLSAGEPGEAVELTVEPLQGAPRTVTLARVPFEKQPSEPRPEKIAEIRSGVWYVDIDRIEEEELQRALPRLAAARAIVFDVRGYPKVSARVLGHLIDEPVSTPHFNIPIVTRPDRQDLRFRAGDWSVQPAEPRLRARVAFLTDERAISAAETFLGIVEHYHLGEIVGRPTAGTNGNVSPLLLPGGYGVSWTGMQVLKQDGSRHHGVGILPTIPAEPTRAGLAAGRDDVLERALSALEGEGKEKEETASR